MKPVISWICPGPYGPPLEGLEKGEDVPLTGQEVGFETQKLGGEGSEGKCIQHLSRSKLG